MKKRLFAGIALVIIIAVGAVIWFLSGSSGGESAKPAAEAKVSASQTPPVVVKLDESSAVMLEKALNSSDATEQAKGLYAALRQGEWSAKDLLPDGAKLNVDRSSFKEDGSTATVKAVVSGSVQAEFTLFLARSDDNLWRVFATERTR